MIIKNRSEFYLDPLPPDDFPFRWSDKDRKASSDVVTLIWYEDVYPEDHPEAIKVTLRHNGGGTTYYMRRVSVIEVDCTDTRYKEDRCDVIEGPKPDALTLGELATDMDYREHSVRAPRFRL